MSVLGSMLGASVPHELTHRGKTYQVSLINQRIKAAFEKKVFARAKEAAAEMRDCLTPQEHQAQLDRLSEGYMSGEFSLETENSRAVRFLATNPGKVLLCALVFDTDEMDVLKLMSERPQEVTSILETVTKESFPAAVVAEGDGEKKAPGG